QRSACKTRTPADFRQPGFINSGNVLLSHNLEMHYHRGCSVSLPCSEWERVVPLRYDHQKAGEAEVSPMGGGMGTVLPQLHQKFWGFFLCLAANPQLRVRHRLNLLTKNRCSLRSAYR